MSGGASHRHSSFGFYVLSKAYIAIDSVSQGLSESMGAFALHDIRRHCIVSEGLATEDLYSGKRVWFKTEGCPSTIPIVGSMSFYQSKPIASAEKSDRDAVLPSTTPEVVNQIPSDSNQIRYKFYDF